MKFWFLTKALLLSAVLIIMGTTELRAQDTTYRMLTPYQSQWTGDWCWAASMKMIMDFHNPTEVDSFSQCDLVKTMMILQNPQLDTSLAVYNCCTKCDGGCPLGTPCGSNSYTKRFYKKSLLFTDEVDQLSAQPDFYDLVFSKFGYSSIQEVNQMDDTFEWDQIKQQIKTCRPFIINIDGTPSGSVNSNHALVVRGFQETVDLATNDTSRNVLTYDPWRPCCNDNAESLLSYHNFTDFSGGSGGSPLINSVLATVHTIQSGTVFENPGQDCRSCELLKKAYESLPVPKNWQEKFENGAPVVQQQVNDNLLDLFAPQAKFVSEKFQGTGGETQTPTSELVDILAENAERVPGFRKEVLEQNELEQFLADDRYVYAPVQYMNSTLLNRRHFLSCLFHPKKLDKVVISNAEIMEIVSTNVSPDIVSALQKREDGNWVMRRISNYTNIERDIKIDLNAEGDIVLNNHADPTGAGKRTTFTLIRYLPFQYEFFSFNENGRKYMAPAHDYPDLGLEARTAYPEARVIRSLRQDTKTYEKSIQNLFATLAAYRQYLNSQKGLNSSFSVSPE